MRALGSQPPSRSPGELRLGKLGYFGFRDGVRFFTHKSSASMMCESAEMIFSPANTESAVYAAAVLIAKSLAFSQLVVSLITGNLLIETSDLPKLSLSYETRAVKSNSLFRRRQLAGAPRD